MPSAGTIHFIPNDAEHVELARDEKPVLPPKGSATVVCTPSLPPGNYPPGSVEYAYWQALQGLNYGLLHWRTLTGKPLELWQARRKRLPVVLDAGEDLNANYDRQSLNFYHFDLPGGRLYTCDSPDVTCHEEGHALLDAMRPDFWGAPYLEVGAFHEAWGDCMAMLVAFADPAQAAQALEQGLDQDNLVSNLAEHMAVALAKGLGHPELVEEGARGVALRRALNDFRYVDPSTLPYNAPARELCAEVHSFSRVFSGCFYDVVRNLFAAAGAKTVKRLQQMAHVAGELLHAAVETVPVVPRFYQAMADRFLQADAQLHDGLHAAEIRAAFERHGLSPIAPKKSLAVPVVRERATVSRAAAGTHLLGALGLTAAQAVDALGQRRKEGVEYTPLRSRMHGPIAHVAAYRPEDVSDVHPSLGEVHVLAPATARVQLEGTSILGTLGDVTGVGDASQRALRQFVRTLVETGNLEADAQVRGPFPVPALRRPGPPTHAIRSIAGRRTVVRVRFSC